MNESAPDDHTGSTARVSSSSSCCCCCSHVEMMHCISHRQPHERAGGKGFRTQGGQRVYCRKAPRASLRLVTFRPFVFLAARCCPAILGYACCPPAQVGRRRLRACEPSLSNPPARSCCATISLCLPLPPGQLMSDQPQPPLAQRLPLQNKPPVQVKNCVCPVCSSAGAETSPSSCCPAKSC